MTFPMPGAPVNPHIAAIRSAEAEVNQILTSWRTAASQARAAVQQRTDLSDEGKRDALTQATRTAAAAAQRQVEQVQARVDGAVSTLERTAAGYLPEPDNTLEGIMARQACWARQRSLLSAGRPPSYVIGKADYSEELYCLMDELPTWLDLSGVTDPTLIDGTLWACRRRMAELEGDAALQAFDAYVAGAAAAIEVEPIINYALAEVGAPDRPVNPAAALTAAIEGRANGGVQAAQLRAVIQNGGYAAPARGPQ
jgi:hypothetical protein